MNITLRFYKEDKSIVSALNELGLKARLVKNGVIVECPEGKNFKDFSHIIYMFSGNQFFINCSESGGGWSNTGDATIICGINGEALKPYYIPTKGTLACAEHAMFSVKNSVIEVCASHHRKDFSITISKHEIVMEPKIQLKKTEIWSGRPEELPVMFERFSQAMKAACEKATDYHCRTPYFIAE